MEFRVLALGDVTSEDGTRHLARTLRPFQKVHGVDFTVVNGENVSGVGLTPDQAEDLFAAGADVITLGNHTWGKRQIVDEMERNPYILRPANYTSRVPGRGLGIYEGPRGLRVHQSAGQEARPLVQGHGAVRHGRVLRHPLPAGVVPDAQRLEVIQNPLPTEGNEVL